ncbi:hypothetical protein H0H92_000693 [Tricholoma furcatifolium]|nr:hypothetical protein H0H92_000693 [Tricholoma furcatifolium]
MAQSSPASDAVGATPTTSATLAELMSALSLGGSIRLAVDADDGGIVLSPLPRPAANPWLDQQWVRDLAAYYAWAQSPPAEGESPSGSSYPSQFVLDEQYLRDYYFAAFYQRVMERGLEPLESTESSTSEQLDSDTTASDTATPALSPSAPSATSATSAVPPVTPSSSPAVVPASLAVPGPAAAPSPAVPAPPVVASVPGPAIAPIATVPASSAAASVPGPAIASLASVPAPPAAAVAPTAPTTANAAVQVPPAAAVVPPTPPAAAAGSTASTEAVDGSDDDDDPLVRWYCITRGRCVGVFARWETVAPLVLGVPNACFARHASRQSTYASFLTAHNQGHVAVVA